MKTTSPVEPTANILLYRRQDPDSNAFIRENLSTQYELRIRGSLDDLSDDEIARMKTDDPAQGVPVVLSDGQSLYADHALLDIQARKVALEIQKTSHDPLVMFCTIPWRQLEDLENVLCPSRLMEAVAVAVIPRGGCIGVIQPDAVTAPEEIKHWKDLGHPLVCNCAPAEPDQLSTFTSAVSSLIDQGADVLVLDCLGFTQEHYDAARKLTAKPIILPMDLIGKTLDSVMSSSLTRRTIEA